MIIIKMIDYNWGKVARTSHSCTVCHGKPIDVVSEVAAVETA